MLERVKPNIWSKWHAQCESNGGKSTWDSQSWQLEVHSYSLFFVASYSQFFFHLEASTHHTAIRNHHTPHPHQRLFLLSAEMSI